MPPNIRQLRVFLCHASQDKSIVRELQQRLEDEGWIDPWLDEKRLHPGEDWRVSIEEAVESSDLVVICLSNNSVDKEGFIQKELRYAREIALEKPEGTIFIIPLRLEDCDVPRGLRFFQWTNYFGSTKDQNYTQLLESLSIRRKQIIQHEEEKARREAEELARLKALEIALKEEAERKLAEQKEEEERKAQEVARLAALRAEDERLAREKAEVERRSQEEAEKLLRAQETERVTRESDATQKAADKEAIEQKEAQRPESNIIELVSQAGREAAEKTVYKSYIRHRKQVVWQIILPVVLTTILFVPLIVFVYVATFSGGDVSRWAAISTIWITVPIMIVLLFFLLLLGRLIYLLAKLLNNVKPRLPD